MPATSSRHSSGRKNALARARFQLDGQMVERLHADMAKRTIAIADAIAAMAQQ